MTKQKSKSSKAKSVLVTTEFRGVFYGEIVNDSKLPGEVTLANVRNCIYWDASVGGFLGLAANGPNRDCKIGVTVPLCTLYKVTSVTDVTDVAVVAWKNA